MTLKSIKKIINNFRHKFKIGNRILNDEFFISTKVKNSIEIHKRPRRAEIINYFLSETKAENYLEIGVRDPKKNFDRIQCKNKYSVDPGIEFKENPVSYKLTSDEFFDKLSHHLINLNNDIRFDVIFIDGLHLSRQVDRDIKNSLEYISDKGFIILHDCNPPTEFHQRENYNFINSPAGSLWNGTTWKAFYKYRHFSELYSICFDTDWGVGVISKRNFKKFNHLNNGLENEYFEYSLFDLKRKEYLNLHNFEEWKR